MSDDTGRDDTVLGTALARAIDSQPVRATPFAQSRLAVRRAGGGRSGLFPVLAAAAAIVLGLALGAALLGQRGDQRGPVASSPSPSATPESTASPGTSPTASPEGNERIWVYFARDQLPPVGAFVRGTMGEDRIGSRLVELHLASQSEVPPGTVNVVAMLGKDAGGGWTSFGSSVRVQGDLATVEFAAGAFDRIRGAAQTQALVQQLVYTITEETGIRRALIKEQGKSGATIDQLVIVKPLTREDVLPYEGVKTEQSVALEDDPRPNTVTTRLEESGGATRFVIELKANETPSEGFWSPRLAAEMRANDLTGNGLERAKSVLQIAVGGARASFDGYRVVEQGIGIQDVDRSPLRFVRLIQRGPAVTGLAFELGLDDARPWRISLEPASPGTMWLIVDIGGHPQAISDSIAVYVPRPGDEIVLGTVGARTFVLKGAARAFEAHVAWRLKDSRDREIATGFVTASLGTSPVWGAFTTDVKVPDNVTGVVTLEVFWPSPRDGAPVGLVAIPLRVR